MGRPDVLRCSRCKRRVVASLLGSPFVGWIESACNVADLFESTRVKYEVQIQEGLSSFTFGTSCEGVQDADWYSEIENAFRSNKDLQRIATLGSECFAHYFPKEYLRVSQLLNLPHAPGAKPGRSMPLSIFPRCTCDLGPGSATRTIDTARVITALGDYDPDTGGDVYLMDFGLRIRFPPGASIVLAAGIRLGSSPVADEQRRYVFTQACVDGVASAHELAAGVGPPETQWRWVLDQLSVFENLVEDREVLRKKHSHVQRVQEKAKEMD